MDGVMSGMYGGGVTVPGVGPWAHGGLCPSISPLLHPLDLSWVEEGQGSLHLQVAACWRATRTCILPPSAPPALHRPGSLPSQPRALGMGCLGDKAHYSAGLLPGAPEHPKGPTIPPGTQGTKACGKHHGPCPSQPPGPAPVLSSHWEPWFPPLGLKAPLKPRGCWGCKTLVELPEQAFFFFPKLVLCL